MLSLQEQPTLLRSLRFHLQIRVKCNEDDTIGDLKKLVAAQTGKLMHLLPACIKEEEIKVWVKPGRRKFAGTRPEKIRIQKWYTVYKDHITLADYEIHDGMGLELYYN